MPGRLLPQYYFPIGFQKLTVDGTVRPFTNPTVHGVATLPVAVIFTCETDQIRFRVDGTDPDGTTGFLINDGDVVELLNSEMIKNFKAIKVTNNAILQITYFGEHKP